MIEDRNEGINDIAKIMQQMNELAGEIANEVEDQGEKLD